MRLSFEHTNRDLANSAEVAAMPYKQHLVEAHKKRYISDIAFWLDLRKLRNKTSHNYFEQHGDEVVEKSEMILQEIKSGLSRMKELHEEVDE